jgi:alkylhydroperoxidase family enzyme
VVRAPLLGSILGPPALESKCIVVAALAAAAAQSAYFLALTESVLARAQDAVAIKARSAAVCDTCANQGSRNSAILPFTSALIVFCAAATAAMVELPFIDAVSAAYGTMGEVALVTVFPILSSAFAAATAVSKARCEGDAEAACQVSWGFI